MGIVERRQRQKDTLRREILSAARQLFAEQGFEQVTMRKLAARIEYSPTAIYLHFKDKHAVLEAVCEDTFRTLAARLTKLAAKRLPPLAYLREGLRLYVAFGLRHPDDYTLTFTMRSERSRNDEDSFVGSAGDRAFEILRVAVRACVEAGEMPPHHPDATAQALWAAAHGLVSLLIAHPDFPFVARRTLIDHTIDTMIAGLSRR